MTPQPFRMDERNHVEKPFLDQLAGLGWDILDLDNQQHPTDSHRENFTEVVMLPVLRERLRVINPWLENDQIDEVVKQLTASFPGTGLLETIATSSICCWRTPASPKTVKRARKARPSISLISRIARTTASSPSANSRSASLEPSTTSFQTSCCF